MAGPPAVENVTELLNVPGAVGEKVAWKARICPAPTVTGRLTGLASQAPPKNWLLVRRLSLAIENGAPGPLTLCTVPEAEQFEPKQRLMLVSGHLTVVLAPTAVSGKLAVPMTCAAVGLA